MTLSSALASRTAATTRRRGAEYFDSGAVVHFDPQQSMVYAVVRGGEDYVVRLEVTDASVRGTCTCPYFTDRLEPCKHIWAVALMCDARRVLQLRENLRPEAVAFVPAPLDGRSPELDDWTQDDPEFHVPRAPKQGRTGAAEASWLQALTAIAADAGAVGERAAAPAGQLLYVIDLAGSRAAGTLVVHVLRQEQRQNGEWGTPKPARINLGQVAAIAEPDRSILERLAGARPAHSWGWSGSSPDLPSPMRVGGAIARDLLPIICATERCRLALTEFPSVRPQDSTLVPLAWRDEVLRCRLAIVRDEQERVYVADATLEGADMVLPVRQVRLLLGEGLAIAESFAAACDPSGVMAWVQHIHQRGALRVPVEHSARLRDVLLASGASDLAAVPEELRTQIIDAVPVPQLTLHSSGQEGRRLSGELAFSYKGGTPVAPSSTALAPTAEPRVFARRADAAEQAAVHRLQALGIRTTWDSWVRRMVMNIPGADLPRVVRALVADGWHVEADGHRYRTATGAPALEVRSGVDWFELRGDARFGAQRVGLPQLLDAIHRRHGTIALDDGTYGVVPEEWLRQLAPFALGAREGDHLRFKRSQVMLLDALLAARPSVSWDEHASALRDRLRASADITPLDPPASFTGALREYQRDALGWIAFLREVGFGGCLADDMGLGKTVVVLALLDGRRRERERAGAAPRPSLVVVPRSVLFNWQQEAARFAPALRVLDLSGAGRTARIHQVSENDLVLITYGTLRRDAPVLAEHAFDYVVLDEAQAIKNAQTAGAKAARLLRGTHKLALSGTPVENRVADLWSIFEFLNPGLLSGATAFSRSFSSDGDPESLELLRRGLRPFILRRTKEQVAAELPDKIEQTIVCDLERTQRTLYNELRDHYRRTLLGSTASWQRSKIQVLEALLRLRQVACHPGLIDPARADDPSAKLDLLLTRLVETIEEGHKALVFSQFTSFLALVRRRLDAQGIAYEYLDGRVRDRESRVARFQGDAACRLFLISLKAGGVGLNLTAADYVFILDPWWNPAAEAQAVDRTHRIGQTRRVFAYRLIARDTVEERVLELQQRKRELADAIITADNSVVRGLQREDLELLLS